MLEQIEKSEHRIYRILSDDAGIPEKELESTGEAEHEGTPGNKETPGAPPPDPRLRDIVP